MPNHSFLRIAKLLWTYRWRDRSEVDFYYCSVEEGFRTLSSYLD